ncbi:MAG: heme ABC transporter ATP-binding protein [Rhodospirillaceae bacterium]|nr:heme ABC transporter ATP-binding protein [Rhodospirillaceae bacterium]
MSVPLVRLRGIERRFGRVRALAGASLELHAGEVHGVIGSNGAGKSTLLNVLGGLLAPDSGTIEIAGAPTAIGSPRDAWSHGIGLVHQHFTLVPALTVRENLALGLRGRSFQEIDDLVDVTIEQTGLCVPLEAPVRSIGVGDRQRTEILKTLLRDPKLLVLDEPTAVLTPEEVDGLFALLRTLAREGKAVALVAHKLDEVLAVSDRLTVLRTGETVLSAQRSDVSVRGLVAAMVGDGVADEIAVGVYRKDRPGSSGGVHGNLTRDVPATTDGTGAAPLVGSLVDVHGDGLVDVTLEVHAGEVLGVAGVEGNGQHELALVLSGRRAPVAGQAHVPEEVAFIPQDRQREGLVVDFDLTENVALALSRLDRFGTGALMPWEALEEEAERIRTRFDVAAPSTEALAGALSGGNQQRVIIGRELALGAPMLVAENPTRGLDVAAAAYVHGELTRLASEGLAIVLISTDLDEVLGLADRVVVMTRGRAIDVPGSERSREDVGALMLSGGDETT